MAGSRITPLPREASTRPASNCGFTRITTGPRVGHLTDQHGDGPGHRDEGEVGGDQRRPATPRRWPGSRRGCPGARGWSPGRRAAAAGGAGPGPRRRRSTEAAPAWSRQSVNPPVEAPASRARRPVTSMPNRSRAASQLLPAPADEPAAVAGQLDGFVGGHQAGRLVGHRPRRPAPLPRSIRATAWGRLSTRPRSTRARSRRRRARPGQPADPVPVDRVAAFFAGAFLAAAFLAAAFFAGRLLGRRPSWPPPSWPAPSWPRPSWPAAFLAARLLGRRLLGRRLLGRGRGRLARFRRPATGARPPAWPDPRGW